MIEQRVFNVDELKEHLMAIWSDFQQDVIDIAIYQWR